VSRGFGSTLVREVATRQLGGSLDIVWSIEGMRLLLTLPASVYRTDTQPTQAIASDGKLEPSQGGQGGRVLVVEDETLIAMELCAELAKAGWEIVGPAATIEEAERLIAESPRLDAAVLDVNLAGTQIYPIAERLRDQHVPFVFCTGYEWVDRRYSGAPIIRKPANIRLLTDELRRIRAPA
jgi:CheY-like chemotaxis protein